MGRWTILDEVRLLADPQVVLGEAIEVYGDAAGAWRQHRAEDGSAVEPFRTAKIEAAHTAAMQHHADITARVCILDRKQTVKDAYTYAGSPFMAASRAAGELIVVLTAAKGHASERSAYEAIWRLNQLSITGWGLFVWASDPPSENEKRQPATVASLVSFEGLDTAIKDVCADLDQRPADATPAGRENHKRNLMRLRKDLEERVAELMTALTHFRHRFRTLTADPSSVSTEDGR